MVRVSRDVLEEEVGQLHCMIACHLNEVIEQVRHAEQSHRQGVEITKKALATCKACAGTVPTDIGKAFYERCIVDHASMERAARHLEELKMVINFYRSKATSSCLEQTMHLQEIVARMPTFIAEQQQWIDEERNR